MKLNKKYLRLKDPSINVLLLVINSNKVVSKKWRNLELKLEKRENLPQKLCLRVFVINNSPITFQQNNNQNDTNNKAERSIQFNQIWEESQLNLSQVENVDHDLSDIVNLCEVSSELKVIDQEQYNSRKHGNFIQNISCNHNKNQVNFYWTILVLCNDRRK